MFTVWAGQLFPPQQWGDNQPNTVSVAVFVVAGACFKVVFVLPVAGVNVRIYHSMCCEAVELTAIRREAVSALSPQSYSVLI